MINLVGGEQTGKPLFLPLLLTRPPARAPRTAVVNLGRSLDERPRKIQLGLRAREIVLAEISLQFSDIGSPTRNSGYH